MNSIKTQRFNTPCGDLVLGAFEQQLCLCNWYDKKNKVAVNKRLMKHLNAQMVEGESDVIKRAMDQLTEYFDRKRTHFDIPLLMAGTDFQKHVWAALRNVPFGQTISYAQLAQNIANKKAIRAVANANAANALSIIVPCHRIIGSNGQLVGYAGGLKAKQTLLDLEQS